MEEGGSLPVLAVSVMLWAQNCRRSIPMGLAALSRGELSFRKPRPALAGVPKVGNVCVSARGCVNVASVQLLAFQAQGQGVQGHHVHLTEGPLVFKCLHQGRRCHWCPNPCWWGQRAPCPALLKPEQRWARRLLCPLALADGDLPSPSTSTSRRLTRSWPGSLRPRGS